ncbi:N-acetyl-gamma-glutamyl-phosphate reductase [Rhodophyticola sp. SM2404]
MTAQIFIDGEVGTTGLQIRARLQGRDDLRLISLPEDRRKNLDARLEAAEAADVAILCLPDDSVREITPELAKLGTRVIDPSSAHRVAPDWSYGFPEISAQLRADIAEAQFVSNPGCYPTGAIALIKPLIDAGLIAADDALCVNAVSGYTGGGKALIAEFENGDASGVFVYGTGQNHKHLPELKLRSGLSKAPIFVPSVGQYAQGMIVQIPLHREAGFAQAAFKALEAHYNGSNFVKAVPRESMGARIDPRRLNDTNRLEVTVDSNADGSATVLIAVLDNLGKGASGAAVQNLNIMLGLDETLSL